MLDLELAPCFIINKINKKRSDENELKKCYAKNDCIAYDSMCIVFRNAIGFTC